MKQIKSILALLLIASCLQAGEVKKTFSYSLPNIVANNTKIRSFHGIKSEQEYALLVIKKFDELILKLNGYEEKYLVKKVRDTFKEKYIITNSDIITIHKNVNESIKLRLDKNK